MKKVKLICFCLLLAASCKIKEPATTADAVDKEVKESEADTGANGKKKINPEDYSLDHRIGQMIMVGINDRTSIATTDPLLQEIKSGKAGGIILFEKNIAKKDSKEKLKALITSLRQVAPIPLFVSIDEEGGRVHRLKEKYGFVGMPSAAYLGELNNTDSTKHYTRQLAALLSELGINLNYAPDVDLGINKENPVIYKLQRSYSANPEVVAQHAQASIEAHHEYGVKTVLKHFPGHGSSMEDSHLGVTDVTKYWNILELMPYKELIRSGEVDAIMSAHIVNCHLDSNCLPATLSQPIISGVLRNLLEYDGVVFSDDMQMYAISKQYGKENSIKMAINAGVDVVMFGNNVNLNDRITASEMHSIIKKFVQSGEISEERINEAFERIMLLKQKAVN